MGPPSTDLDPSGPLRTPPRTSQDPIWDPFGTLLGPLLGPFWDPYLEGMSIYANMAILWHMPYPPKGRTGALWVQCTSISPFCGTLADPPKCGGFGTPFGTPEDPILGPSGPDLGPLVRIWTLQDPSGPLRGPLRTRFGTHLGPFWDPFWDPFGTPIWRV